MNNPRPTVLVAESDPALRDLLRLHLGNGGYEVILAPDAVVAGRTILQGGRVIDALVIGAQLPFMSGIDFVSTLIADTSQRLIPTIVIATSENDAGRADVLGVPSLLAPFSAQRLLEVLRTTIRSEARLRIVVADDEPDTVSSLTAILSHEGHSVVGTHRASEVLPEVRRNKPDAMILDIDMPGISGFAIAREIREAFGEASPQLVAVSGKWFGQTDRMLAQLAGFDHFLQKPCSPDTLLALLARRSPAVAGQPELACEPSLTFQT
jgi:DNA-binding response OmpR family regulator